MVQSPLRELSLSSPLTSVFAGIAILQLLKAEKYSGVDDDSAVTTAPYVSLDITDASAVEQTITEINPDVVIHCAAWTAVDMAEDDDKVELVRAVNAGGTQNIADVCKKLDCKMVYISTDYVFDGQGTEPWQPDCKLDISV